MVPFNVQLCRQVVPLELIRPWSQHQHENDNNDNEILIEILPSCWLQLPWLSWLCHFHSSKTKIYFELIFSFFSNRIYWFYMQIRQLTVLNKTLFTLTQTFRNLNCCCNFFLYSATSSLFRRELREMFQCTNISIFKQQTNNTEVKPHARTLSSPPPPPPPLPPVQVNKDNNCRQSSENQNLLSITEENINLPDSTNGHTVSFHA